MKRAALREIIRVVLLPHTSKCDTPPDYDFSTFPKTPYLNSFRNRIIRFNLIKRNFIFLHSCWKSQPERSEVVLNSFAVFA